MNLLVVTGIFPPDPGGPASYVPKMATALRKRGHRVEVVTLSDRLHHDDDLQYPFPVHRIRRRTFWPWRALRIVLTVWRCSRGKDLVYVNGLGSEAALGALLAWRPTVHKIVGDYAWERARGRRWFPGTIDDYQRAPKGPALRLLDLIRTTPLRLARRIIVPSRYLRDIVAGWGLSPAKIEVIYNAVAPALPNDPPVRLPAFAGRTVITVCRLVPWKGLDDLIQAVAGLPDTRLVIAGDGPERTRLEELVRTCGAAERVLFLGHVAQHEVASCLAQADTFVLNSSYEGLPHVVLEAMAVGVPVIATRAGGTPELVEHEATGLLVPVGDRAALEAALRRLHADAPLAARLAGEATRRLAERFHFDTMLRATEQALATAAGCTLHPAHTSTPGVP